MSEKYYDALSDMSRIKESLIGVFEATPDITGLIAHCFDTPYIEGSISDNKSAIFIDTSLIKSDNQHIKEVGIDIFVICHKDFIKLSEEETNYYHSIGIYGNRLDSAIQAINATINKKSTMDIIKGTYSIGNLTFAEKEPIKQYASETDFYGKCLSYTYQSFYKRKNYMK